MSEYFEDVKKYDAAADETVVDRIVKYLGIALRDRDSANVAASDKSELARVKANWCEKKLGVSGEAADQAIAYAAQTLATDRTKSRVTFYYLVAKQLGKLDSL